MIKAYQGKNPSLAPTAWIAENAVLVGHTTLEDQVSIWYGAVLRGDEGSITVGAGSNIQDNAVLHCEPSYPVQIGRDVTVGHGAIVHGCTVGDGCMIGMGAVLLNGCRIGAHCLVAAGALVTQNKGIPSNSLVMGSPAKVVRALTEAELAELQHSADTYRTLAAGQLPSASGEAVE